jgi:hypothetical protein
VKHQLELILEKNHYSFWFFLTLTRYIVCLFDFEVNTRIFLKFKEEESKKVRVGEFLLCL